MILRSLFASIHDLRNEGADISRLHSGADAARAHGWLLELRRNSTSFIFFLIASAHGQNQIDAITGIKNLPVYNVKSFGALGDSQTDDTAAIKAALAAVSAKGGGYLFFPYGSYEISSQINIPTGVQIFGLGWSNPPEYGLFGTTIQANGNFPGNAPFPQNMMLAIDGPTDTYGSGASNLTVDCNSVPGCGGLYRGHANEQTYFKRINVVNYSSYGFYICGAGENSDAPHVCGGNSTSGAQGDGPDEDLQFYPGLVSNANTLSVVIRNDLSYRGMSNITINAYSDLAHQPLYAGWFSGATYAVRAVHMEGPANGFYLGPPRGTLCPTNCNGLSNAEFSQVDLNTRGGPNTIVFNSVQNLNLRNITGVVLDTQFGQNISSVPSYLGFLAVGLNGQVMSNDPNFGSTAAGPGNFTNSLSIRSSTSPQFVIQNEGGPNSPFMGFTVGTDGSLTTHGQGGTGDWLFTSASAVFGIGSTAPFSGLNLQSPFTTATGNMHGVICSNARWVPSADAWGLASDGGSDYACAYFPGTGGFSISASSAVLVPGTITQPQFLANTHLNLTGAGSLILGPGSAATADSGQTLQVLGGIQMKGQQRPVCTPAIRGTLWFVAGLWGTEDHVLICAQNSKAALLWQQLNAGLSVAGSNPEAAKPTQFRGKAMVPVRGIRQRSPAVK